AGASPQSRQALIPGKRTIHWNVAQSLRLTGCQFLGSESAGIEMNQNRLILVIHPIHSIQSFEITAPYTLRVRFDDDTEQTINFEVVLAGALYRPLRDLSVFNQVKLDPEVHTLVWPNG